MDKLWIVFILIYSLLKGSREVMKKAALKKSSSSEILFFYTLIGFILTLPFCKSAFELEFIYIVYSFLKAGIVCTAWIFALKALKSMSVSLYGIMDLSRMIFSTLLGVIVLGESLTAAKIIGIIFVLTGLILANLKKSANSKGVTVSILVFALLNCFFNAVSGTMDKILMQKMNSSQLQFWFMLFMTLIYGAILLIKREKVYISHLKSNYWIIIMSLSLIIGDKLLFEANASPLSEVTVMTIIKQSSVLVTVLTGWIFFKEKHILYKLFCTAIILSGIFVAIL